jgi:hypothetical protein
MRTGLLSLLIIGLLSIGAVSVLGEDRMQSHYNASGQAVVTPVVRYHSYYGGPGWYVERGPRYYNYPYYNYPVPAYRYRAYVVPGPVYRYGSYEPFDFYYNGPRVRFGFGF